MNDFLIFYLIGCATAFVQMVSDIYIGYKDKCKDIVVGDIFEVACATLASWVFVVAYVVSGYTDVWNKVVYKSKQKEE